jgi:hypothetical protein
LDLSALVIRLMRRMGLAWDVVLMSATRSSGSWPNRLALRVLNVRSRVLIAGARVAGLSPTA